MTIPVNPQLCFRWGYAAAMQEHVISMVNTGVAYHTGNGVEQNDESAVEWYIKAAEKGQLHAQYNLGEYFKAKESVHREWSTVVIVIVIFIS